METSLYLLRKISSLMEVSIAQYEHGRLTYLGERYAGTPFEGDPNLVKVLLKKADLQTTPVIHRDGQMVTFATIKKDKQYYLIGPMNPNSKNQLDPKAYYEEHHLPANLVQPLPLFPLIKTLELVETLSKLLLDVPYTADSLIMDNHLLAIDFSGKETRPASTSTPEETEHTRRTFEEEQLLLEDIKHGNAESALAHALLIDQRLGLLSDNVINHWRYAFVAAIALCTRAAMESGADASEAYEIGDFFIKKIDETNDFTLMTDYRNQAITELCHRVLQGKSLYKLSPQVRWCCDYINQHYNEKITLTAMASAVSLNSAYLSRLFSREMGQTIQQYIIQVRLRQAEKLLKDPNVSVTEIAQMVHFSTQSHFSDTFHKWKGITPSEYRKQHLVIEPACV